MHPNVLYINNFPNPALKVMYCLSGLHNFSIVTFVASLLYSRQIEVPKKKKVNILLFSVGGGQLLGLLTSFVICDEYFFLHFRYINIYLHCTILLLEISGQRGVHPNFYFLFMRKISRTFFSDVRSKLITIKIRYQHIGTAFEVPKE